MQKFLRLNQSQNRWLYYLLFLTLGILLTLSFYPVSIFPFWLILGVFSLLIRNCQNNKDLFLFGAFFGYGYFLIHLYWIPFSIYKVPLGLSWLVPILSAIIPIPFALLTGFFTILTKIGRRNGVIFSFNFAFLWVIFEYLRSNIFFPFSIGLLGYSSTSLPFFAQTLSLFGAYGAGLLITLFSTSIFSGNRKYIAFNVVAFLIICAWGMMRISTHEVTDGDDDIHIRLVQPNAQQHHFGDQKKQEAALNDLSRLTLSPNFDKQHYIFWPEAAFPYPIHKNWLDMMQHFVPPNQNAALIFGADRVEYNDLNERLDFNSLVAVAKNSMALDYYDKRVLVPFGEYVPYRNTIYFIEKIAHSAGIGDIVKGKKNNVVDLGNGVKILPLICSESIADKNRLKILNYKEYRFILNATNDFWFGKSLGPYQHFNISVVRAIEYGLPMIRVANTGVSGVVDVFGNVIKISKLDVEYIIDVILPPKLKAATLFYQIDDFIMPAIVVFYIIFILYLYVSRRRT
ncbi:apolipoprotein N-acyltransferase [Candidatus Bandiella euplotis]|uniref:Apolipoprotein N-acyltransferase n=1 Tax=Candidatus Bandiella euplotis TaxID=1664265 RepID=A0ABZ0UKV8_9RICK|nr:apolipoprotein N-acyltransferase [Candidatus Bandiella woodruffii]WPX95911.1 Apolipoprotein N-acyltransferase [Candidatus Bandiella woodruffii]